MLAMLLTLIACGEDGLKREGREIDSLLRIADTLTVASPSEREVVEPLVQLTSQQQDSLRFRLTHHYSVNFNFMVKADSLRLLPRGEMASADTLVVHEGDLLVVADVKRVEGAVLLAENGRDTLSLAPDTFFICVAHDQETIGWVEETELLSACTPDDDISRIIDGLTDIRLFWMSALLLLGVGGFGMKRGALEVNLSIFNSRLLLLLVGLTASVYASVQMFAPEFWQEFYFHPTMNPLLLPWAMASLVTLVWLTLIVLIAVLIEVYERMTFSDAALFVLQLCGLSVLVYLLISWTTRIYVGYVLLVLLAVWLFSRKGNKIFSD